jgi:hypothetical protein
MKAGNLNVCSPEIIFVMRGLRVFGFKLHRVYVPRNLLQPNCVFFPSRYSHILHFTFQVHGSVHHFYSLLTFYRLHTQVLFASYCCTITHGVNIGCQDLGSPPHQKQEMSHTARCLKESFLHSCVLTFNVKSPNNVSKWQMGFN